MLGAHDLLPPSGTETSWFNDIQHVSRDTGWLHGFMHAWALYGGLVALVLLVVLAYLLARRRPQAPTAVAAAVWCGAAALIALGLNQLVSHWVQRPRPFNLLPHVLTLVGRANDYSFPSDHATIAGAIATGLLFFSWRLGLLAWLIGLFLAFARVYVGVHYPADVAAGLALGALVSLVLGFAGRPILAWLARLLDRSPLWMLVRAAPGAAR